MSPRRTATTATLSVVVPCYNEIEVIAQTHARLLTVLGSLEGLDLEIVYVDDGSIDTTPAVLSELAESDERVVSVFLARNFGHQRAATAGLALATGDVVVLLDADLQDPPEIVLEMLDKWREGYDVAYGRRRSRAEETWFKRMSARVFYRLVRVVSDVPVPVDTGDFRLMDRAVVDALLRLPEQDRFLRGMVAWLGFRQAEVLFDRPPRTAGISKYPLKRMIALAGDGLVGFSTVPLRAAVAICALASVGLLLVGACVLLWPDAWSYGRASLLTTAFAGSVGLGMLAILGEYTARLFREAKARPLYVVREVKGARHRGERP